MADFHILMADVIGSSRHEGRADALMTRFKSAVQKLNDEVADRLISPYTITLGDEFQGIPDSLATAVRSVVRIEELLLTDLAERTRARGRSNRKKRKPDSFQLRYAINFGPIETPINEEVAHGMLGRGLTEARRMLTAEKRGVDRVQLSLGPGEPTGAVRDAFRLLFHFVDDWKTTDAFLVSEFLAGRSYQQVAATTGLHPSSTFRRYRSLNIASYQAARRLVLFLGGEDPDDYDQ